ncbi:SAM dependent carboxyl methyltransferase [Dillenia turbinata]|uniref:SAM dependent carboxyl methyltransferase n=1 Tax=Dillenia turbinata TaxID=194707 RepID=A0AAN8VD63_9MAGN
MDVKEVLCMNGGEGDNSYVQNSTYIQKVARKLKPLLENAVRAVVLEDSQSHGLLNIADLGCASGANTFFVIATVVDTVKSTCQELNRATPDLQIYLNDLVANDFNSLFKGLTRIQFQNENMSCFVMGAPGSFYGLLFPRNSMHFLHSCYCVHWLSQVPPGLTSEGGLPLNKGAICISKTSPPLVSKAYLSQFQKDLTLFLSCRSKEMTSEGRTVFILHGRSSEDPTGGEDFISWQHISKAISDLVSEGLIEEEKLDSFNVPYYTASKEEIIDIVEKEGSFTVELIETSIDHFVDEDMDNQSKARKIAKNFRCFSEPVLAYHFGNAIMDKLYDKIACNLTERLATKTCEQVSISVVLRRKATFTK